MYATAFFILFFYKIDEFDVMHMSLPDFPIEPYASGLRSLKYDFPHISLSLGNLFSCLYIAKMHLSLNVVVHEEFCLKIPVTEGPKKKNYLLN